MSKTIFDYDSSDEEEYGGRKNDDMYAYGTAVLNHESITKTYRERKKSLLKATDHAKSITIAVTQGESGFEEFLFTLGDSKFASDETEKAITAARLFYKELLSIQGKYTLKNRVIVTEKFRCFVVLKKYSSSNTRIDDEVKGAMQSALGIRLNGVDSFLQEARALSRFDESLDSILNLNDIFPDIAKSKVLEYIVATEDIEADHELRRLTGILKLHHNIKENLKLLKDFREFYEQLKAIQNDYKNSTGIINLEKFKCFYDLKLCLDASDNSKDTIAALSESWGVNNKQGEKFLTDIKKIREYNSTITNIMNLVDGKTSVTKMKIQEYIAGGSIQPCMLPMFYDREEYFPTSLTRLSEFDKIVNDKIKELKFFGERAQTAENFLVNGLLYQKYLKTLTKFAAFRACADEIVTKINVLNIADIDTKSSFSTGLKRTEEVVGLGTYAKVTERLLIAQSSLKLTNDKLIECFKKILRGENLYKEYTSNSDAVKTLYDITYLLFSCEVNRNPSALISNAIYLELVRTGKYLIQDIPTKMPMAMVGAIQVGRYCHHKAKESHKKINDYGDWKAPKNDIENFQSRQQSILRLYTSAGGNIGALVNDWYGITLKGNENLSYLYPRMEEVAPFFYEYTMKGINDLLRLKLHATGFDNVTILPIRYNFNEKQHYYIDALLSTIAANKSNEQNNKEIILAPISLNNEHAVGLMFVKQDDGSSAIMAKGDMHRSHNTVSTTKAYYIDPSNEPIPNALKEMLQINGYLVEQLPAEQQKYTNCGPEVIENFMLYLTGERLSQEDAIPLHSKLFEEELKNSQEPRIVEIEDKGYTNDEAEENLDTPKVTKEIQTESSNKLSNETNSVQTDTKQESSKVFMEGAWQQPAKQSNKEVLVVARREKAINSSQQPSSIGQELSEISMAEEWEQVKKLNAKDMATEGMDQVWQGAQNFNTNELNQWLEVAGQQKEASKEKLESAVWTKSQVPGTESMPKLPKTTYTKEVVKEASILTTQSSDRSIEKQAVAGEAARIDPENFLAVHTTLVEETLLEEAWQQGKATDQSILLSPSPTEQQEQQLPGTELQTAAKPWYYGAEKVIASMAEKVAGSFVDTLRMAMYVSPHDASDVMRSALHAGGCAVPYSPEFREMLSQHKFANSSKSFNDRDKFPASLPSSSLLDGIELSRGDAETWLQQFKLEAPLLGE